jgi:chromosome segregation ATPase
MSTLGCFSPAESRIYIFNITSEELDGIKESVLSHELLHSIYQRLNGLERSSLNSDLQEFYDTHHDLFGDYLSKYSETMFYTELHSIVGQRLSSTELPESLRNHYAKYFKNQDKIAGYYKKYRTIFDELTENINRISAEVQEWRESVENKRKAYKEHLAYYEEIRELHNQRSTNHYYQSGQESYAAYLVVLETYNKVNEEREALNADIDALNDRINELNEYVERSNKLNNIVNSHVDTTTEKTSDATD